MNLLDILEPRSLNEVVSTIKKIEPFVLTNFFGPEKTLDNDVVMIPKKARRAKLAKFANPGQDAHLIGKNSSDVMTLTVPGTFEKKIFTVKEAKRLRPFDATFTPTAQIISSINSNIIDEIDELTERAINLREWMACQALATGVISVDQEDIKFEIDFEFVDGTHWVELTGADKWNVSTAKIMRDCRKYKARAKKGGFTLTDVLLGEGAAAYFLANAEVQAELDKNNYAVGRLDLTKEYGEYGTLLGTFAGMNIWEYNQTYLKDDDTEELLIPTSQAIFVAKKNANRVYRAPIERQREDGTPEIVSTDMFLDVYQNKNKTNTTWELEQKALPAILDKNFVVSVKVY